MARVSVSKSSSDSQREGVDRLDESTGQQLPMPVLEGVPESTQLVLRDLIRGLEAEAGTARALALRADRDRDLDHQRFALHLAGLRATVAGLEADLAETRATVDSLRVELAAALLDAGQARAQRDALAAERGSGSFRRSGR